MRQVKLIADHKVEEKKESFRVRRKVQRLRTKDERTKINRQI